MAIRAVGFDWDGPLLNSFAANNRFVGAMKTLFFRYARSLYGLGEFLDAYLFRPIYSLHDGSLELIAEAKRLGMTVGIVTDRSLFGFVKSAEAAGLDLSLFDFIHCRTHLLDCLVYPRVPESVAILQTKMFKGEHYAFAPLLVYLGFRSIRNDETLVVDDYDAGIVSALQNGMHAIKVDRMCPDFARVWKAFRSV